MADPKEDAIKSIKKDKEPDKTPELIAQENQPIKTIMPTMIDDSADDPVVQKRDLSAIIPEFNPALHQAPTDIELISKDNVLKSDGSVSLGTIDSNGEVTYKGNFSYPIQIDVEARKIERQKSKRTSIKKEKKKMSKGAKEFQNQMALMSLIIIIALAAVFYWIKTSPTEKDFVPLNVTIELGEKLPIRTEAYVKPGKGKIDELLYSVDTTAVEIEKVGEYPFTVTYKGYSKEGKIRIVDTTNPELTVRNVTIIEGASFDAESFVGSCIDFTGCKYSFQDVDTTKKYTTAGVYDVYITAFDAYQNSVTKKARLIIEAEGSVKNYRKETGFDFNTGYAVTETYELHFNEFEDNLTLINGIYTKTFKYQDTEVYQSARKVYNGEPNYKCNDNDKTIVLSQTVYTVGSNYSDYININKYLLKQGYTEQ